jgi:hypothetical protein
MESVTNQHPKLNIPDNIIKKYQDNLDLGLKNEEEKDPTKKYSITYRWERNYGNPFSIEKIYKKIILKRKEFEININTINTNSKKNTIGTNNKKFMIEFIKDTEQLIKLYNEYLKEKEKYVDKLIIFIIGTTEIDNPNKFLGKRVYIPNKIPNEIPNEMSNEMSNEIKLNLDISNEYYIVGYKNINNNNSNLYNFIIVKIEDNDIKNVKEENAKVFYYNNSNNEIEINSTNINDNDVISKLSTSIPNNVIWKIRDFLESQSESIQQQEEQEVVNSNKNNLSKFFSKLIGNYKGGKTRSNKKTKQKYRKKKTTKKRKLSKSHKKKKLT